MRFISVVATALLLLSGCSEKPQAPETSSLAPQSAAPATTSSQPSNMNVARDYHSYANVDEVIVTHIALDITADFSTSELIGSATLDLQRVVPSANKVVLDTRDLTIDKVSAMGTALEYTLAPPDPELGSALSVELPDGVTQITIDYTTSPNASGVQWLTPLQTAGKRHPFLFTQAQAVHARSFIPLQDSPKVRVTYEAIVRTPKELLAVMSAATRSDPRRKGVHKFVMEQPIPSYLIALAIGDLQFKAMGERTGVYAEPELLEAAAKEFEDTESMLLVTENKYGPYSWERYDLLILPPSFPFGGMENPRLSFITPTVIAGDKSLVALIAHELAHSWSGNTVTNATWRDLWLNEGFTTYLTYRIMEMIYGSARYNMEAVLGYQDLQADIASLPAADQIMAIDLRGRNPDDVFSNIPYEKGALFLREIEQRIGRDNFDAFLLQYFEAFAFKSITTDEFVRYVEQTLLTQYPQQLSKARIEEWIFAPGIPEGAPVPESDAFSKIDNARSNFLEGQLAPANIDTSAWTVHEWLYFLNNLPTQLSDAQLAKLDSAFDLTNSLNNEIAHSWLMIAVANEYQPAYARLYEYLVSIGRNKLVKPLYRELSKTPEGKAFAKRAFEQAKPGYHPLTIKANEGFIQ